jgi:hypothetical protein
MVGQDQDSVGGGLDPAESHQGELDELRVYRGVLNATEIQALYARNSLPVLHWAFGEGSGPIVADSAGCGNTGTVSAAQWVTGPVGNALRLTNTTSSVKRQPVNRLGGAEISAAFWVKTTDSGDAVVSYATGTSANEWLIQDCANLLVFRRWQWVRTGVRVNDGLWHHVAVTWRACDGQTVVYKDGVEASRKTLAGSAIAGNGCLMLGQDQDNVGGGLDPAESHQGELDEVRVYRRALSASEVQALFGQGTPASGSEAEAAAAPLIALDAASSQGPSAARVAGDSGPTWIRTGTASDGDVATEGPGASEGRFAPFDRTAGAPAIAEVRSDWPGPVRVMTSDDGPGQANGWAAVDGDLNTAWRGAPGRSAWWLALAYEPELVLAELTVRFGEGSLTNAAYRYSRDAVEWLDLRAALTRGPVALTYLWMGIPSDGTTNTLRVVEIESESPVRPSGLPAASTNDSACP